MAAHVSSMVSKKIPNNFNIILCLPHLRFHGFILWYNDNFEDILFVLWVLSVVIILMIIKLEASFLNTQIKMFAILF